MDICTPCGRNCTESDTCDNWKCAIGCADSKFSERVFDPDNDSFNGSVKIYTRKIDNRNAVQIENLIGRKMYQNRLERKISNNIDFTTCHPTWQTSSIDLAPASVDNKGVYYAVAIPAMIINVVVVVWQLNQIRLKDIHATTYRDSTKMNKFEKLFSTSDRVGGTREPVWQSDSQLSSAFKVCLLVSTLISCVLDSIFDAIYYIKLKTVPRIIHVRTHIDFLQGFFLYLGELVL